MPLTPEDVSNKRFTAVRLREGYDMAEVDQFLDEVEAELSRLTKENADLRGGAAPSGAPTGSAAPSPAAADTSAQSPAVQSPAVTDTAPTDAGASESGSTPATGAEAAQPTETIKVHTAAEASGAAIRLLEIATRNADELVGEAQADADRIREEARVHAEQVEADARTRSELLESETTERRAALFGDLDRERDRLNGEVDNLRSFEREYRSRLKSYFSQQLAALDGNGGTAVLEDGQHESQQDGQPSQESQPQPSRLQSLLGRDADQPQG